MPSLKISFRHTGLVVADLESSIKFWCEIMGFKISVRMEESGIHIDRMMGLDNVKVTTVKLIDCSANILELLCFHSHSDSLRSSCLPYSLGFTHIALTVDDIDQVLHQMRSFGCAHSPTPQLSPNGKVKVVYATGPEGVILELVESIKK